MDQKEPNLQLAVANFKAGKFKFGSEATRAHGVSLLTFNNRLNGKKLRQIILRHWQKTIEIGQIAAENGTC